MAYEFEGERRVVYGDAHFLRRCPKCWRFVKPHTVARCSPGRPNADCKRCGPVQMPFEGYV